MIKAVIDIGTNSTRLLVAREGKELHRQTTITRLGQGLRASGSISSEALEKTIEVILKYVDEARSMGAEQICAYGTAALREAANSAEAIKLIEEKTGIKVRILTGEEEAEITFLGAVSDFGEGDRCCVVDLGGGSFEVAAGIDRPDYAVSLPIGAVKLKEKFRLEKAHQPEQLEVVIDEVKRDLEKGIDQKQINAEKTIAVGGTATTYAALTLGLSRYEREKVHGSEVTIEQLRSWTMKLGELDYTERMKFRVIEPERTDVIVAGGLILLAFFEFTGKDRFLVSEKDNLDGFLIKYSCDNI